MGYRDASPPEPTTVPYGQFRSRKGEWLIGICVFLVGIGSLVGITRQKSFRCERSDGAVRCEAEGSWLWTTSERRTFEGDQLTSVEWVPFSGTRNAEKGRTDLFDAHGNPTAVLRGDRTEAHAHYQQLRAFLDDPTQERLVIEQRPVLWGGLAIGLVALLWFFFIARSIVRTSGRFDVEVDHAGSRIVVHITRFGMFRQAIVHPLEGLAGVAVDYGYLRRANHGRGSKGEPAAQLRLDYEDGLPRKLTTTMLPSPTADGGVHEDLAERLREVTGLEPESRPVVVGAAEGGGSTSKPRKGWAMYLVFLVPVAALLIGVGLEALVETSGGRVHFRAEQRCKFQGGELLPGGEMSMSLAPGEYVIEIFDPTADGGWRADVFEVREGQARDYVCR